MQLVLMQNVNVLDPTTQHRTREQKARPQRGLEEQRAPPQENLIYDGKLCTMYADYTGRALIAVIPRQNYCNITDMYPVDISYLFNECRLFCEHYRIRNYTTRVHQKDWAYSPHMHLQISMSPQAYSIMTTAIGIQQHTNGNARQNRRSKRVRKTASDASLNEGPVNDDRTTAAESTPADASAEHNRDDDDVATNAAKHETDDATTNLVDTKHDSDDATTRKNEAACAQKCCAQNA